MVCLNSPCFIIPHVSSLPPSPRSLLLQTPLFHNSPCFISLTFSKISPSSDSSLSPEFSSSTSFSISLFSLFHLHYVQILPPHPGHPHYSLELRIFMVTYHWNSNILSISDGHIFFGETEFQLFPWSTISSEYVFASSTCVFCLSSIFSSPCCVSVTTSTSEQCAFFPSVTICSCFVAALCFSASFYVLCFPKTECWASFTHLLVLLSS